MNIEPVVRDFIGQNDRRRQALRSLALSLGYAALGTHTVLEEDEIRVLEQITHRILTERVILNSGALSLETPVVPDPVGTPTHPHPDERLYE